MNHDTKIIIAMVFAASIITDKRISAVFALIFLIIAHFL